MSRIIFTEPIELDRNARLFIEKVAQYPGVLGDDLLVWK